MTQQTIAIIDYGMGNLHSVASALQHVGQSCSIKVTDSANDVLRADRVVFPGVGSIAYCIEALQRLHLDQAIRETLTSNKPLLAICVGMQALMTHSEENQGVDCLDIIAGSVRFFGNPLLDTNGQPLKVPHMGWNQLHIKAHHERPLWHNIPQHSYFYFAHSYYVTAQQRDIVCATADYSRSFDAALHHRNLCAVQFHPEKSGAVGLQLLKNFIEWDV